MKKGKQPASKPGSGGFAFSKDEFDPAVVFEGYPPFEPEWDGNGDTVDYEADFDKFMNNAIKILKYSDEHPPKIEDENGRTVCLCLVFESRAQLYDFMQICGILDKEGSVDTPAEDFAEIFGIDLTTGKMNAANKKMPLPLGKADSASRKTFNFNFTSLKPQNAAKKPEISEKLSSIRADEKKLADYLDWVADGGYYFFLCFRNEQEKANLLKALGLEAEFGGKYIWCHDFAKALGVELIPCEYKNKPVYSGREKKLEALIWRGE